MRREGKWGIRGESTGKVCVGGGGVGEGPIRP